MGGLAVGWLGLLAVFIAACAPAAGVGSAPPVKAMWRPSRRPFAGRIKAFWFGANSSGLDSPATLALLAKHEVSSAMHEHQVTHPLDCVSLCLSVSV